MTPTDPTRADLLALKQRIEENCRHWTRELAACTAPDDGYEAAAITELVKSHKRDLAHVEDHLACLALTGGDQDNLRHGMLKTPLEVYEQHTARLMAAYGGE